VSVLASMIEIGDDDRKGYDDCGKMCAALFVLFYSFRLSSLSGLCLWFLVSLFALSSGLTVRMVVCVVVILQNIIFVCPHMTTLLPPHFSS